jgi:hypothetical protein
VCATLLGVSVCFLLLQTILVIYRLSTDTAAAQDWWDTVSIKG